jgi:hypothetical protein
VKVVSLKRRQSTSRRLDTTARAKAARRGECADKERTAMKTDSNRIGSVYLLCDEFSWTHRRPAEGSGESLSDLCMTSSARCLFSTECLVGTLARMHVSALDGTQQGTAHSLRTIWTNRQSRAQGLAEKLQARLALAGDRVGPRPVAALLFASPGLLLESNLSTANCCCSASIPLCSV